MPSPAPAALPSATLAAYGCAHFGKSLLWYASELLLIYSLTEHAGLDAARAGGILALGLVTSAGAGLLVARGYRAAEIDLASVGRRQAHACILAASCLLLLFATPLLPPGLRLGFALLAGLPFRIAYACCDIAQGALLSLVHWPWRDHRGASALRLAGSGLAAMTVGLAVNTLLHARGGPGALGLLPPLGLAMATAVGCTWWLRRRLAGTTALAVAPPSAPQRRHAAWRPLLLVALASLTLPTFTKFAPYAAQYTLASPGWGVAVLCAYALGTTGVQPLAARWSRPAAARLPALGLALCLLGIAFPAIAGLGPAAAIAGAFAIGAAAGASGHCGWAWHAETAREAGPIAQVVQVARLTACAQLALAAGSGAIGLCLAGMDYRSGRSLEAAMAVGPLLCGLGCLALAALSLRRHARRGRLAVSA